MARSFVAASSEYLLHTGAVITAAPLTVSAWFRPSAINARYTLVSLANDSNNARFGLWANGVSAGDPVTCYVHNNASDQSASTTTGFSANQWHHACGVERSAADRSAYIDGGSRGNNTGGRIPVGVNSLAVGRSNDATPSQYMDGAIAEVAIWRAALSDAEIMALAKRRLSALLVRPGALVFYAPLLRPSGDDYDWQRGYRLVDTNTVGFAKHPGGIVYPSDDVAWMKAAAGGALIIGSKILPGNV